MKNLFAKLPKKFIVLVLSIFATLALGTAAVANFGPDRTIKEWTPAEDGFDYVTFNSYTNVAIEGSDSVIDERNFLEGVVMGRDSQWADPVTDVRGADVVEAKIYIHNNANPDLNDAPDQPGIARNVNVRVDIPTGLSIEHEVKSYISASNAKPKTVFDSLDITSINDSLFQLDYVPGSARLTDGTPVSDALFSDAGVSLPDQYGCTEFIREIVFEMEIEKPAYRTQKTARIKGEDSSSWRKVVNAERGDVIEWRIWFINDGDMLLEDVKLVDDLPSYVDVVPGSVQRDAIVTNPDGSTEQKTFLYGEDSIQGDQVNINIYDYAPGADTFTYLETQIQDHEDIQCGIHQIANVAYLTPSAGGTQLSTLNDNAKVNIINEECETPEPVTACVGLSAPVLALVSGESVDFTAEAFTDGPSLEGFIFEVDDQEVQNSASNVYTFTAGEAGQYTVRATAKFENGNKTSDECVKTVTVTEETDPVYACSDLTVSLVRSNTYKFTVDTTAENGATVKDYSYNFGDDSEVMLTDKNMVEHTYQKEGTYKAEVTVRFNVDGEVKTAGNENCMTTITFDDDEPEVEGVKKKKVLPNTGAGSIAGAFAALTAAGAAGHHLITRRRK